MRQNRTPYRMFGHCFRFLREIRALFPFFAPCFRSKCFRIRALFPNFVSHENVVDFLNVSGFFDVFPAKKLSILKKKEPKKKD